MKITTFAEIIEPMKNIIKTIFAAALAITGCTRPDPVHEIADRVFELAKTQYTLMDEALGEDDYPKTADAEGKLVKSDLGWWCSGFYPGSLWYIYEYTGDENFREAAWRRTRPLEKLITSRHTDHDIGFQINCSFGNALRLTGDSSAVVPTYIAAARKLAARQTPETGVTCSWNWVRDGWQYPVIIDNMMNLELLTTAARMSGEKSLEDAANLHAATTLKNHFRPDWSSWHLVDYDPVTGDTRSKVTVQGYADESAWARGQAWALYGFTMMYRETGLPEYLDAAENIAEMILGYLPEDGIPYWDFNAPGTPKAMDKAAEGATMNRHAYADVVFRDASAGAIMASAFVELSTLTKNPAASEKYLDTARRQLTTFATEEYLAGEGENAFFILKHCVGNIPENSEVDVPLSYADYYFLEALVRYCRL